MEDKTESRLAYDSEREESAAVDCSIPHVRIPANTDVQ